MDGIIKDIVFAVMGNYTVDEARTNSEPIKQEILKKIQERFSELATLTCTFFLRYTGRLVDNSLP